VKYRGYLLSDYFRGLESVQPQEGQPIGVDENGNFQINNQRKLGRYLFIKTS